MTGEYSLGPQQFPAFKSHLPWSFLAFIYYLFTMVGVRAYDIRTDYKLLEGRNCVLFL